MKNLFDRLKITLNISLIAAILLGTTSPAFVILKFHKVIPRANPIVMIVQSMEFGYPVKLAVLLAIILFCIFAYLIIVRWRKEVYKDQLSRNITQSDTDSYGSARFAKEEEYREYAPARKLKNCSGLVLGRVLDVNDRDVDKFIDFHPEANALFNGNVCVFGASGSGKSSCFVKPTLVQIKKQRGSIIVSDPKGEMYNETNEMFRDEGYIVRVFDLIDFKKSDGWDPIQTLIRMGFENLEAKVEIFAYTMVKNMDAVEGIYKNAGKSLIKAILFFIILNDDVKPHEKNIRKLKELLAEGYDSLNERFSNCSGKSRPAKTAFDEFKVASNNLYGNIFVSIQTGTSTLGTEEVANILCSDDIDMASPGEVPTIIYCRFSVTNNTYQFIIATFFATLFEVMFAQAAKTENISLKRHVHFILDEFANIGQLPDWAQKMSTIRSYNITAYMIVQDYTQFANNYPNTDVTIRSNCATWICMGLNDEVTAKLLSERVGEMTQEIRTSPEDNLGKKKNQTNVGMGKRMFLNSTELFEMDKYLALIIFQRKKPVLCRKAHISIFPESKYPIVGVSSRPNITDIDARTEYRKAELARREAFYAKFPPNIDPDNPKEKYDPNFAVERSVTEIADKNMVEIVFLAFSEGLRDVIAAFADIANAFKPQPKGSDSSSHSSERPAKKFFALVKRRKTVKSKIMKNEKPELNSNEFAKSEESSTVKSDYSCYPVEKPEDVVINDNGSTYIPIGLDELLNYEDFSLLKKSTTDKPSAQVTQSASSTGIGNSQENKNTAPANTIAAQKDPSQLTSNDKNNTGDDFSVQCERCHKCLTNAEFELCVKSGMKEMLCGKCNPNKRTVQNVLKSTQTASRASKQHNRKNIAQNSSESMSRGNSSLPT